MRLPAHESGAVAACDNRASPCLMNDYHHPPAFGRVRGRSGDAEHRSAIAQLNARADNASALKVRNRAHMAAFPSDVGSFAAGYSLPGRRRQRRKVVDLPLCIFARPYRRAAVIRVGRNSKIALPYLASYAQYGFLGVPVFFIISGFVIAYSAEGRTPVGFAIARFSRIYPTFLFCVLPLARCTARQIH